MGDGGAKGQSATGEEGQLQFHSGLMLMAQVLVPCWNQVHICMVRKCKWEREGY